METGYKNWFQIAFIKVLGITEKDGCEETANRSYESKKTVGNSEEFLIQI